MATDYLQTSIQIEFIWHDHNKTFMPNLENVQKVHPQAAVCAKD